MIDRLEELLGMMGDEDEDGQEDALALGIERAAGSVPAPVPESGTGEGAGAQADVLGGTEDGPVVSPIEKEGPGIVPRGSVGPLGERRSQGDAVSREVSDAPWAGIGRPAGTPGPVKPQTATPAAEAEAAPAGSEEAGLEELYRRTARAVRPAAQGVPEGRTGRTRPAEEPGGTAALTVDELDRAVKRDSRRYDGGMSIF